LDPDPDPTPDPTLFFIDFKDKIFFSYFFLITRPQVHNPQYTKFHFLLKFYLQAIFQSAQRIYD
jgi:hypothetical protein